MNAPHPLVSIGIPVWNGEAFLEKCLDSICSQTFEDFEVVISDNGSTDATTTICQEYAKRDKRIILHRHERNQGAAWNYNYVLEHSRGKFFKWAAHDDEIAPNYLEKCLDQFHSQAPDTVLCYPRAKIIDENGHLLWEHWDNLDLPQETPRERLKQLVFNLRMANVVFGLIRRDSLLKTRRMGSYPTADYILLAELALIGKFSEIPEFLFLRRFHEKTSRNVNRTTEEVANWFDPANKVYWNLEYARVFLEHLVSIARSDLPIGEKMITFYTFSFVWMKVWKSCLWKEIKGVLISISKRIGNLLFNHGNSANIHKGPQTQDSKPMMIPDTRDKTKSE